MHYQGEEGVIHGKAMLAVNNTGAICECSCGCIHFSFGPVLLTLSHQEFLEIVDLSMNAVKQLKAHADSHHQLTSANCSGRMQ